MSKPKQLREATIDYDEIYDDDGKEAVKLTIDDRTIWVPRSWIKDIDHYGKQITVPEWWAIENRLV